MSQNAAIFITHNHYIDQLVNVVYGNNRCLPWELYETDKYTLWVIIKAGGT
jgi:hypothetical protein